MARPSDWWILDLDRDPTPGVVESVQALAKQFHDFADDAESAWRNIHSFGGDAASLAWIGQTADAFKSAFGPLPDRMKKLYTSYREAGAALDAYWPKLQAAQTKADNALNDGRTAHDDVQRLDGQVKTAAATLKSAQTGTDQNAVTDAQHAHDTAQTNLNDAQSRLDTAKQTANHAHDDRISAAKECATALHHASSDGIHNKHWWEHVGEVLSEVGGEIADIAGEIAPILDIIALATSWIPGVDVITAALAEAANIIALVGTVMKMAGDGMQGHWGDALMGAGMLGLQFVGGKAIEKFGGPLLAKLGARGDKLACEGGDPVDVVSGRMIAYETDVALPATLPLFLRRAYSSGYEVGRLFGPGWSSSLDQRLSVNAAGIHFAGDDAQVLDYPVPEPGQAVVPVEGARWPLEWDRDTDEIRISDPWGGYTWHFAVVHFSDDNGQIRDLTTMSDRNGNRIWFHRDEHGTPTLIEHSGGYQVAVDTMATSAGIRVTGLRLLDENAEGGSVGIKEYRYDDRGRMTGVVNSSGLPYTYEYDHEDRIAAFTDRIGFRYAYEYDEWGRVVCGTGNGGFLSATFTYDQEPNTTIVTDSLGQPTTYRYDDNGHIVAVTDPLGNTILTDYDRYGRLLSRVDALGGRTVYEHDENGDPIRMVAPDGVVTEFEYNGFHQILSVQTAQGSTWRREYDERGNVIAVHEPNGAVTVAEYTGRGAIVRGIDPMGSVVTFETDAAGLPVAVSDPLGGTAIAARDAFGRIVSATDAVGATSRFQYTVEGLLASRVDPTGARTSWTHDAEGNLTTTVDPLGATTRLEVGPFGRANARIGADGVRHEFVHDTELNVVSVTAAGAAWRYEWDAAGRLVSETDFIGRSLAYEYDAVGRMVSRATGLGERIGFEHDAAGRLVRRRTPDGDYEYEYDTENRVTRVAGPSSAVDYMWDASGRLAAETVDGRTTAYEYDLSGRRVRRVTPGGAVSEWSYDAAGNPSALRAGIGALTFGHNAAGHEVERFLGGAWLRHEFDAAGRVTAQRLSSGDSAVVGRDWVWRADGTPAETRDSLRGTRRFQTDATGRVTGVSAETWSESYAYDAFGNVASDGGSGGGADDRNEVTHDADRTLTRRARRTTYDHDAAGRIVRAVRRTLDGRRIVREYSWDSEDRLVQTVTPDGAVWRYAYDPLGRRTAKARIASDGSIAERTVFVWEGPVLAEQHSHRADGSVTVLTWDYDPGTVRPAAQRRRSWAADADQDAVDEVFHAIVTDLVGTPTELVDGSGALAWYTSADLWGRTIATSADDGVDCPLRFPGQYHDAETGLNYNLHRYYDPESASYLTPDPLGLVAGPNDHAYVANPLTDSDPFGLMCDKALLKWAEDAEGKAHDYHSLNADAYYVKNGTTAVVRARFPDGKGGWVVKDVVAHSGAKEMDLAVQSAAIKNGDIPIPHNLDGFTHAEYNALRYIDKVGGVPVAGGASRSVCDKICGPLIRGTDGKISGQWYSKESGTKQRTFFWSGSMTY